MSGMLVPRAEFEAAVTRVRAATRDPVAGIFGPDSHVWRINREAVIFLGGGRAALLQLAHPFVAQAVADHSTTRTDPLGRFLRTFEHVFAIVYGDLDSACTAARRVRAIHERIIGVLPTRVGPYAEGTPYGANLPDALLWVHATLWDTSIQVYELVVGELTPEVKAAYYDETKRFAWLFGIPDDILPATWNDFRRYCDGMYASPQLTVSPAAAEMGRFLLDPARTRLGPVWHWYAAVTAALLPERVRQGYGLDYGALERRVADMSLATLRATWWLSPGVTRYLPAYLEAQRRLAGVAGPHPMTAVMDRVLRFSLKN
jgi:uncharacterized protein (DUF2236 family)